MVPVWRSFSARIFSIALLPSRNRVSIPYFAVNCLATSFQYSSPHHAEKIRSLPFFAAAVS